MFIASKHNFNQIINNPTSYSSLTIGDASIPLVNTCRNLGIVFDPQLNWATHINALISKSYFKLKSIYRFKYILSPAIKLCLCDTLVLSIFNYCDILFSNITKGLKHKIQRVQNACLRFAYNTRVLS